MHITFESGLTAFVEVGTSIYQSAALVRRRKEGTAVINNRNCDGKIVRLNS
jgi:hypothetical protein